MKNHKPVLIVAQPGRVRDGLQALLKAIPQLEIMGLAKDVPAALEIIAPRAPSLVLLDVQPYDGRTVDALGQIRERWPYTRCLVLADSVYQQQAARSAGADDVLIKGFSTTSLFESVQRLVSES